MLMTEIWKVSTNLLAKEDAEALADTVSARCADDGVVVAAFEVNVKTALWRVEAYFENGLPDPPELQALFDGQSFESELLPDTDWVSHSQSGLSPIRAGRFYVHGAHDRHTRPTGAVCIEIQAGQAFGTGHHGTTRGCLLALDDVLRRLSPLSALDVGCGSAVLAIAFGRAVRRPAYASDIDPVAIRVAAGNIAENQASAFVRPLVAVGVDHPEIAGNGPFELVFANILAAPLTAMKKPLSETVATNGRLVLSGITVDQEDRLLAAYRPFGLVLEKRWQLDGWSTLLLRR